MSRSQPKKQSKLVDKTGNQINVIYPYKTRYGGWVFDDTEVGLHAEPFVMGIPAIIDGIVGERENFTAFISKNHIPNYTGRLMRLRRKETGWYKLEGTNQEGWLCPATLRYFKDYPEDIFFRIE